MWVKETYLDLDELLDTIHDSDMLISSRRLANHGFISGPHPSSKAIRVIEESLLVGFIVVQVAEDDGWRLNDELSRLFISCDLNAFDRHDLSFIPWEERATCSEEDVGFGARAYDSAGFGETWTFVSTLIS